MSDSWAQYSKAVGEVPYQKQSNKELRHLRRLAVFELDVEAWQELWLHTLRLVIHIVRKLQASKVITYEEYQEAIAVGNEAAGEALLKWDPRRSPYQSWLWKNITWSVRGWSLQERSCGVTGAHGGVSVVDEAPEEGETDDDIEITSAIVDILREIDKLPEGQAYLIQQVYLEGRTIDDLSKERGITYSAVHKLLNQGLDSIKKSLGVG